MNPVQNLALSKFKATERNEVAPGNYAGQFTVTIQYDLRVGEDYQERIVAKADPWALVAVAMSKLNGVTIESIVRESQAHGFDLASVKSQVDAAMGTIKAATVTDCKGKVTGSVKVIGEMTQP